jgi:hypothetical protein
VGISLSRKKRKEEREIGKDENYSATFNWYPSCPFGPPPGRRSQIRIFGKEDAQVAVSG